MDDAPIFTEEDIEFGENTPILGPEYSAALTAHEAKEADNG